MKVFYYTASGTELLSLAAAVKDLLKEGLPLEIRAFTAENFASQKVEALKFAASADVLVFLPHGGEKSLPGLSRIIETAGKASLIHVQPVGGSDEDQLLVEKMAWPKDQRFLARVFYLRYGGRENFKNFFKELYHTLGGQKFPYSPPKPLPAQGIYHPKGGFFSDLDGYLHWLREEGYTLSLPKVGIWFYQGLWVNGDLAPVKALVEAIERAGGIAIPVFHRRFVEKEEKALKPLEVARKFFMRDDKTYIDVLISLQPFAQTLLWPETKEIYPYLNVCVLQGLLSFSSSKNWEESSAGLSPLELGIWVAQPEFDGTLITYLIATREEAEWISELGLRLKRYEPLPERTEKLAILAFNWARLRRTPPCKRKIAVVFHHYPPRADRLGCAFGLDSFASVAKLLKKLQQEGYYVRETYSSGEELAQKLLKTLISDTRYLAPSSFERRAPFSLPENRVQAWIAALPEEIRQALEENWGKPPGKLFVHDGNLFFGGIKNGNILLTYQPPRGHHERLQGFSGDPSLIHDPHLPPTYHYIAFYRFLAEDFGAHAVIHVGKHGTLEWLPGKAVALSEKCYPDLVLGTLPNIYPYIVNDPGEGTQAKRRSYCVIIDHMIPPQMFVGRYGELDELSRLLEEYHLLKKENPTQTENLKAKIIEKAFSLALEKDLSWSKEKAQQAPEEFLRALHDYLDEIAHSFVNDGLHILGQVPKEEFQTLAAMAEATGQTPEELRPLLFSVEKEITYCLKALNGEFVDPGPSGAPTRGELDIFPTGRNFFSVDPQKIPSELAWERGVRQAKALLARHYKDHGVYPRTLAMVIWGSPTMRTRGEDLACALYLLGVRPIWHPKNKRVEGLELISLQELARPRIDVLLRTSGFFRDAFPNLIELFDQAVQMVALLDEKDEENFVAANFRKDLAALLTQNHPWEKAQRLATLRVFSDPPGAYGAGVGQVLDTGSWKSKRDLAEVYVFWGGYAYGVGFYGKEAHDVFRNILARTEVTYKNDDTREVDILSCDCPNAYHGGLNAAIEVLRGQRPVSYSGSTKDPERPKIRTTEEEMRFLMRTKVFNPRWIEGLKRHGYKGAGDLSRLIDYCFQWDATSKVLTDDLYEKIAQTYALSQKMQAFFLKHNPAALFNIVERLLEAVKRGLWQDPSSETLEKLENLFLQMESLLE